MCNRIVVENESHTIPSVDRAVWNKRYIAERMLAYYAEHNIIPLTHEVDTISRLKSALQATSWRPVARCAGVETAAQILDGLETKGWT